jgi:hypothetical protein
VLDGDGNRRNRRSPSGGLFGNSLRNRGDRYWAWVMLVSSLHTFALAVWALLVVLVVGVHVWWQTLPISSMSAVDQESASGCLALWGRVLLFVSFAAWVILGVVIVRAGVVMLHALIKRFWPRHAGT